MYRKLTIIFILAGVLAVLLYLRPWQDRNKKPPRFFDRLPEADIIGKSKILDLSRSLSVTLYHYKIPLREFLSQEFILGQGKSFGLDLQKPVFFFINQDDWEYKDFGAMIIIKDSSKVRSGIEKLRQHMPLKDTIVNGEHVYKHNQEPSFMAYGKDWMLIYNGPEFSKTFRSIINAGFNEIPPKWRDFLNNASNDHHLEALIAFDALKEEGFDHADINITNDTTGITFHTAIHQVDTVAISLKTSGEGYEQEMFTKNNFNLHFDVDRLRHAENDPIHKLLKSVGKKISFPTQELLNAWEGDLAYRQGGLQKIQERYIESELDENFNVTEVVKTRTRKVQAFSICLSLNENGQYFINRMFDKGILTEDGNKYRLLFSPPLKMVYDNDKLELFTSKLMPPKINDSLSHATWTYRNTAYEFYIDSIGTYSIYSRIRVPLDQIVKENMPTE